MTPVIPLQTTQPVEAIDTVSLVLLVVFVISVVVLAILLLRPWWTVPTSGSEANDDIEESDPWPSDERMQGFQEPRRVPSALQSQPPETIRSSPSPTPEEASLPVWLANSLPPTSVSDFAAIAKVVTTLVEASNRGDLRAGFALYSPRYREQFLHEIGLDQPRFEEWVSSAGNRPAEPTSVSAIKEVTSQPDGSVQATVTYRIAGDVVRDERIIFIQDPGGKWLIDNIAH